jgi:hypothetical protein
MIILAILFTAVLVLYGSRIHAAADSFYWGNFKRIAGAYLVLAALYTVAA